MFFSNKKTRLSAGQVSNLANLRSIEAKSLVHSTYLKVLETLFRTFRAEIGCLTVPKDPIISYSYLFIIFGSVITQLRCHFLGLANKTLPGWVWARQIAFIAEAAAVVGSGQRPAYRVSVIAFPFVPQ